MIEVKEILDEVGIDYKISGKNVGRNDINIDCPYCGADYHLAIHSTTGQLNCWVCGFSALQFKPTLVQILIDVAGIPFPEAKDIIKQHTIEEDEYNNKIKITTSNKCEWPEDTQSFDNPENKSAYYHALNYLQERNFTDKHIKKYKLKFTGSNGDRSFRIIIPIFKNGKLVNWTARDYTKLYTRYLNCPVEKSKIRMNELLYGIEDFKGNTIRLVEGVFDKMRLGNSALAIFKSKSLSSKQLNQIIKIKAERIHIIFDNDAYSKAVTVAGELSSFFNMIKVVKLPEKTDPADLNLKIIKKIEASTGYYSF